MSEVVPERYQPTDDRSWATKEELYERYWRDIQSVREIADDVGTTVSVVTTEMDKMGIPRRSASYRAGSGMSPVQCFYEDMPPTGSSNDGVDWSVHAD